MNVIAATKAALNGIPRRVALGHVEYVNLKQESRSRFFVIAAGVGVDAHLFYKLHSGAKQRMGMTAYYAKAWNLWFTYDMARFSVEYETESRETKRSDVTELLAVRIRNFGGVVRELAPGASLDRNDMRLVLARTSSRLSYLAYVIRGVLGAKWSIPGVDWAYSAKATCQYASSANPHRKIYLEADGELLGTLPAQITVVRNALTVLAPAR
jgi:diacylglycerol kinase (ATP)